MTEVKDCNTCANATEDFNNDIDNGCYMCSKGYENNYEPNMTEQIKREECHVGIYPYCIEFENGKVIRNCYACIEKYGYAKGVYAENQKNKKTWEEVLQELEEARDRFNRCHLQGEVIGIVSAIEVINQKLAEIEE